MATITESLFGPSNRRRCVKGRASYIESVDSFIPSDDTKFDDFNCNESSNDFKFTDDIDPDEIEDEPVTIDLSDFLKENPLLTESDPEHVDSSIALSDCHSQFRVTNSLMDSSPITVDEHTLKNNITAEAKVLIDFPNSTSFCDISNSVTDFDSTNSQPESSPNDKIAKTKENVFAHSVKSPKKYIKPKSPLGFSNPLRKYKNFSKMKDFIKNNIKEFGKYPIVKCEKLDIENYMRKNNIKVSNWPISHTKSPKKISVNSEKSSAFNKKISPKSISKVPKVFKPISFNKSIPKHTNVTPTSRTSSILVNALQPKIIAPVGWKSGLTNVPLFVNNMIETSSVCQAPMPPSVIKQSIIGNDRIIRILSSNVTSAQHPNFNIQNCKLPIVPNMNKLNGNCKTFQIISPKCVPSMTSKSGASPIRPKPFAETVASPAKLKDFTVIESYKDDPTSPIKPKPILSVPVEILPQTLASNNLIKGNLGVSNNKSIVKSSKDLGIGIIKNKSPIKSCLTTKNKLSVKSPAKSLCLNGAIKQVSKPIRPGMEAFGMFENSTIKEVGKPQCNSATLVVDAMQNAFKVQVKKSPRWSKQNVSKIEKQQCLVTDTTKVGCHAYNSTLNDILFGFGGSDFTDDVYSTDIPDLNTETCQSTDVLDTSDVSDLKLELPIQNSKESRLNIKFESSKGNKVISKYKYKRKEKNLPPQDSDTVPASEGGSGGSALTVAHKMLSNPNCRVEENIVKKDQIHESPEINQSCISDSSHSPFKSINLEISNALSSDTATEKNVLQKNQNVHISPKKFQKHLTCSAPNSIANDLEVSDIGNTNMAVVNETILQSQNSPLRSCRHSSDILKNTVSPPKKPRKVMDSAAIEVSKINLRKMKQTRSLPTTNVRGKRRVTYLQSRLKTKRKIISTKSVKSKKKSTRPADIIREIKTITGGKISNRGKKRMQSVSNEKPLDSIKSDQQCVIETSDKIAIRKKKTKSPSKNKKNKGKTLKVTFKRSNLNQNSSSVKTLLSAHDHTLFESVNESSELENNQSLPSTFREGKVENMGTTNEDGFVHDTDASVLDQKQGKFESEASDDEQDLPFKELDITCAEVSGVDPESITPVGSIEDITSAEVLSHNTVCTTLVTELVEAVSSNDVKSNVNDGPMNVELQNVVNPSNLNNVEKSSKLNEENVDVQQIADIIDAKADESDLNNKISADESISNDDACEKNIDLFHEESCSELSVKESVKDNNDNGEVSATASKNENNEVLDIKPNEDISDKTDTSEFNPTEGNFDSAVKYRDSDSIIECCEKNIGHSSDAANVKLINDSHSGTDRSAVESVKENDIGVNACVSNSSENCSNQVNIEHEHTSSGSFAEDSYSNSDAILEKEIIENENCLDLSAVDNIDPKLTTVDNSMSNTNEKEIVPAINIRTSSRKRACPKVKISAAKSVKSSKQENSSRRWYISERKCSTECDLSVSSDITKQGEHVAEPKKDYNRESMSSAENCCISEENSNSLPSTMTDNTKPSEISGCSSTVDSSIEETSFVENSTIHPESLSTLPVIIKEEPMDIEEMPDSEYPDVLSFGIKTEPEIVANSTKSTKRSRKPSKKSANLSSTAETAFELTANVKIEKSEDTEKNKKKAVKPDTSLSSPPTPRFRGKKFTLEAVSIPFKMGWMRELVHRSTEGKGKKQSDVYYFSPEGTKLRSMPDILNYLTRHKVTDLTNENFTFAKDCIYREPFEVQRSAKQKSTIVTPSPSSKKKSSTPTSLKSLTSSTGPKKPTSTKKSPESDTKSTPKTKSATPETKFSPKKISTPKKKFTPPDKTSSKKKCKSATDSNSDVCTNSEKSEDFSPKGNRISPKSNCDSSKARPSRKIVKKVPFDNSIKEKSPLRKNKRLSVTLDGSSVPDTGSPSPAKIKKLSFEKSVNNSQDNSEHSLEPDFVIDDSPEKLSFITKKHLKVKFPFHKPGHLMPEPCTYRCTVANIEEPKIKCAVCLCLFHPSCVPHFPNNVVFYCKQCAWKKLALYEDLKKGTTSSSGPCLSDESDTPDLPKELDLSILMPAIRMQTLSDKLICIKTAAQQDSTYNPNSPSAPKLLQQSTSNPGYTCVGSTNAPLLLSHLTRPNLPISSSSMLLSTQPRFICPNRQVLGTSYVYIAPKNTGIPRTALPLGMRIPLSSASSSGLQNRVVIRKLPQQGYVVCSPSNVLPRPTALSTNNIVSTNTALLLPAALSTKNLVSTNTGLLPMRTLSNDLTPIPTYNPPIKNYSRLPTFSKTSNENKQAQSCGNAANLIRITPSTPNNEELAVAKQGINIMSPPPAWNMSKLLRGYECLNLIFKKLNIYGLLKATQVCGSWKQMASQETLWKTVSLQKMRVTDWEKCCASLQKHGTKTLDLCDIILEDSEDPWKSFKAVVMKLCGIRELMLDKVPPSLLGLISAYMPQLLKLECFITAVVTEKEMWSAPCELELSHLRCLTRLRTLKLGSFGGIILNDGARFMMPCLPNLRHLSLTGFKFQSAKNLEALTQLKELLSLELGDCLDVEPEIYELLAKLVKIKNLRLENGGCMDGTQLSDALSKMERLEQLELMNYKISSTLSESLEKLMELVRINVWPDNTEQSPLINYNLFKAVSSCKRLKYICWGIIAEGDSIPDILEMQNPEQKDSGSDKLSFEELFNKLVGLFSDCRVEVKCVPRTTWKEFCSARK